MAHALIPPSAYSASTRTLEYPICCGDNAEITKAMTAVLKRWKHAMEACDARVLAWSSNKDSKLVVTVADHSIPPKPDHMSDASDSEVENPITIRTFEVLALTEAEEKIGRITRSFLLIEAYGGNCQICATNDPSKPGVQFEYEFTKEFCERL